MNRQMRRNCSGMVGPSLLKINQKQQQQHHQQQQQQHKQQQQQQMQGSGSGSGSTRKRMLSLATAKHAPFHWPIPFPLQCWTLFLETLRRLVVSVACAASDAIDDSSEASTRRRVQQESVR